MKVTAVKTLAFILLFGIVDALSGPVFLFLMSHAKPSAMKDMYNLATTNCKPDIVILGSSRAMHHYDSRIIQDSLGVSCMNYGAMSNGIVLMFGRYKLLTRYHTPKMVIYDIHYPFDLSLDDNSKYIPALRPFAYDKEIKDYICRIDARERYKLYSHLYRFNGMFQELLAVQFKADNNLFNGYSPLYGEMKIAPPHTEDIQPTFDTLKINLFKEMVADCCKRGIKLCFLVSPSLASQYSKSIAPITEICRENDICYEIFDESEAYPHDFSYFHDSSHLNDKGVQLYTKMIIPYLRNILNQQQ